MFIDSMSRQPVYEQIVDQVEQMILSGLMRPGEQLPSVRSLSLELSINPNTIQKAYAELDGRGIIYTLPGRGGGRALSAAGGRHAGGDAAHRLRRPKAAVFRSGGRGGSRLSGGGVRAFFDRPAGPGLPDAGLL